MARSRTAALHAGGECARATPPRDRISMRSRHRIRITNIIVPSRHHTSSRVLEAIRERCGGDYAVGVRMVGQAARDTSAPARCPATSTRTTGCASASYCAQRHGERAVCGLNRVLRPLLAPSPAPTPRPSRPSRRPDGAGVARRRRQVDFLNVNVGNIDSDNRLASHIPSMHGPLAPQLERVAPFRAFGLPVFHACRIIDLSTARRAIVEGVVDMVGMTRAHIADPHIVNKLAAGREADIRPCVGAGYCLDRIYVGLDALCLHNPATGREASAYHETPPAPHVAVGAGTGATAQAAAELEAVSVRRRPRAALRQLGRGAPMRHDPHRARGWTRAWADAPPPPPPMSAADVAADEAHGGPKKVVGGGGPAGSAARVRRAGHATVLMEASGQLGGQLRLAQRATWRRDLPSSPTGSRGRCAASTSTCGSTRWRTWTRCSRSCRRRRRRHRLPRPVRLRRRARDRVERLGAWTSSRGLAHSRGGRSSCSTTTAPSRAPRAPSTRRRTARTSSSSRPIGRSRTRWARSTGPSSCSSCTPPA